MVAGFLTLKAASASVGGPDAPDIRYVVRPRSFPGSSPCNTSSSPIPMPARTIGRPDVSRHGRCWYSTAHLSPYGERL